MATTRTRCRLPVVPISEGVGVASRPIADLRASTDTFGAAPAIPELSGVANEARSLYEEQKRKSDDVAVLNAATDVSNLETTLATHARSQLGTNAYAVPDQVQEAWQKGVSQIGKGLTNDDQQLAFNRVVANHWTALNATVQEHVAQQHKVVDQQATSGYTEAEMNAAVANYMDPIRVSESIGNSAAVIRAYGERNGEDPEQVKALIAENTSKIHVAVIDRMLANDQDLAAKSYYDTVKDQIDVQQAAAVDRAVQIGSSRVAAQKAADDIMKRTTTRAEALEEVDKIDDPKVQDSARQRVERLWTQKDDNAREVMAAKMQQATDIIRQTGDYAKVPPSTLVGISASDDEALRRYAKVVNEGVPVKTDLKVRGDLENLFSNPETRDAAIKLDLNQYVDKLDEPDMKHFQDLKGGLIAKDGATTKKLDGVFTNTQIIDSAIRGAGIGLNPANKKTDADAANTIKQTINQQITDLETHAKRPATTKEVTDITNEVLMQHLTSGGLKRFDQMTSQDSLLVTARDIPRTDYRAIVQQLRAQNGVIPTDDQVVAAYKASLNALRPRGR